MRNMQKENFEKGCQKTLQPADQKHCDILKKVVKKH
jgi:hypothetical protein